MLHNFAQLAASCGTSANISSSAIRASSKFYSFGMIACTRTRRSSVWLEAFAAGMLVLGLGLIYAGAHLHSNQRTLYRKDEIIRFIPPTRR